MTNLLTNLIASVAVTISTNTVEKVTGWANHVRASCPEAGHELPPEIGCTALHYKGVDPNEKTITTTAQKVTTFTFEALGQTNVVSRTEILWQSNKVVRLQWVDVPPTNYMGALVDPTWRSENNHMYIHFPTNNILLLK